MGMDVFGKKPISEEGKYFRRSVWGWRRLATIVCALEPKLASKCQYWQSNDGDGLNAKDSIEMANRLEAHIASGKVKEYVDAEDAAIKALPRVTCFCCHGVGIRTDEVGQAQGQPDRTVVADRDDPGNPRVGLKGTCNCCGGWGSRKDDLSMYGLDVESVEAFAKFMKASGGFKIC